MELNSLKMSLSVEEVKHSQTANAKSLDILLGNPVPIISGYKTIVIGIGMISQLVGVYN